MSLTMSRNGSFTCGEGLVYAYVGLMDVYVGLVYAYVGLVYAYVCMRHDLRMRMVILRTCAYDHCLLVRMVIAYVCV